MTRLGLSVVLMCAACTGQIDGGPAAVARIELSQGDSGLVLTGSPADRGYHAVYPNPTVLGRMQVDVLATGRLSTACQDASAAAVDCNDPPFFSSARVDGQLVHIQVRDIYGVVVVEAVARGRGDDDVGGDGCPYGRDDVGNCLPPGDGGGDGCPYGRDDVGNCLPPGDDSGGDQGCPDDVANCGACPDDPEAIRERLCELVNQRLAELGQGYVYDCAELDGELHPPTGIDPNNGSNLPCNDLTGWVEERIDVEVEVSEACWEIEVAVNTWIQEIRDDLYHDGVCTVSPLVLDLDGDGVTPSSVDDGVSFDLLGTGAPVRCAWTDGRDAFLALDRNRNGAIDGGAELFGNATGGRAFPDGFAALAELDADGDGRVTGRDPAFPALRLWRDADRDGRTGAGELSTLADHGIAILYLDPIRLSGADAVAAHGNLIPLRSRYLRRDGRAGALVDVFFRGQPPPTGSRTSRAARGPVIPAHR